MDKSTHIEGGKEFTVEPVSRDEFKRQALLVMDRKTGELYDPKIKFDELMGRSDIDAVFKRLALR